MGMTVKPCAGPEQQQAEGINKGEPKLIVACGEQ